MRAVGGFLALGRVLTLEVAMVYRDPKTGRFAPEPPDTDPFLMVALWIAAVLAVIAVVALCAP